MVNPGLISPRFSAWSRMYMAMRSLMEPVGFMYSHLTRIVAEPGGTILLSRARGVLPTASRMVFLIRIGASREGSESVGRRLAAGPNGADSVPSTPSGRRITWLGAGRG